MNRAEARNRGFVPPRLMAADWSHLTEPERDQALEVARHEGRRAARWYLEAQARETRHDLPLRDSRWAQEHEETVGLPNPVFLLYASLNTLACEDDYITFVIEVHCPEQADRWWATRQAERQEDPRVCAFCDGYERERRRILILDPLPTGLTDLQIHLAEAREWERESGRAWLTSVETAYGSEEGAESQRCVMHWEYQRSIQATDLAQMLLDAALHRARLR